LLQNVAFAGSATVWSEGVPPVVAEKCLGKMMLLMQLSHLLLPWSPLTLQRLALSKLQQQKQRQQHWQQQHL